MNRIAVVFVLTLSMFIGINPSSAAQGCSALNTPLVADDGATVTLTSITVAEKSGSNQLTISYSLLNSTPDRKLDEGSFKIFFANGESIPQYGGFDYLFPGDSKTRSHTWEYLKSQVPTLVEYNAGFFTTTPSSTKLNWMAPGGNCIISSVTVKPTDSTPVVKPSDTTPIDNSKAIDSANEAAQAASDATDAALAAADAADAATTKAQEAVDSIASLATQISSIISAVKSQVASLASLVLKIQKKTKG